MNLFRGNTSSDASYTANVGCNVTSFILVNKTGGALTINITVNSGSGTFNIIPYNLSLDTGEMYLGDNSFGLLIGDIMTITTSGSLDYYFNLG